MLYKNDLYEMGMKTMKLFIENDRVSISFVLIVAYCMLVDCGMLFCSSHSSFIVFDERLKFGIKFVHTLSFFNVLCWIDL